MQRAKLYVYIASLVMVVLCLAGSAYMALALPSESADRFFFQVVTVIFLAVVVWFGKNVFDMIRDIG